MAKKVQYPRNPRYPIDGEVLIKRPGKPTLKAREGNISEGGLFIQLDQHDLQKGRKVDIIIVRESGTVRDMQRLTGIVIRIDPKGVAMVTYNSGELKRQREGQNDELIASAGSPLERS